MDDDLPAIGLYEGALHRFPVRVFFEDTDLSGIVYHANYLRYMERARTGMLFCLGINPRAAFEAGEGVYAVVDLQIRYQRPAKLYDELIVASRLLGLTAATSTIQQRVMRGDETLTDATVTAAFILPSGRPRRQPRAWIEAFEPLMERG